ncbi:serine hydrolase domain-containing protein [Rhodohalobacter halophilus]|uniref:serine hydrolase domain-containing protein n=1 Tax=Rhodohalobacter halophilus TaxID=1812810 RepID=UPI0015B5CF95|nr:serine hydrolase domain-containing protein [Rhodohalobacter halophilus]
MSLLRNYTFILLLILTGSLTMKASAQDSFSQTEWDKLEQHFSDKLRDFDVVGGALLYMENGEENRSIFQGYADMETERRVDEHTIFHWASITKTFTAVAIMQLRDRGLLTLDDALTVYLPELRTIHNPYGSMDEITIRMALNHSTGLRNSTWPWGGDKEWHPFEPMEWSQLVAMFPYTEVEFEPGTKHSYSNPAIIFLGKIIEQLSGDSWESYVDKQILKPLEMHHAYFNHTPPHLLPRRSNSYQFVDDEPVARGFDFHTGITTSNGGLNAPISDMVKYVQFLLGVKDDSPQILSRSSLKEMWREELEIEERNGIRSSVGLSFFLEEFDGMQVIGHTGTQFSYYSWFYIHPETGRAVISVINTDGKHDMFRFRDEIIEYTFKNLFSTADS